MRGEGGVTGEGRLVGNQSFIPGISVPQQLSTPLACIILYLDSSICILGCNDVSVIKCL